MKRNGIPEERLHLHACAAPDEGQIADQQRDAELATTTESAGGAVMVMLRAAAESGSDGVQTETDLALEVRSAENLESMGAPVAAARVRGAVADERAVLTTRDAVRPTGDRP